MKIALTSRTCYGLITRKRDDRSRSGSHRIPRSRSLLLINLKRRMDNMRVRTDLSTVFSRHIPGALLEDEEAVYLISGTLRRLLRRRLLKAFGLLASHRTRYARMIPPGLNPAVVVRQYPMMLTTTHHGLYPASGQGVIRRMPLQQP